MHTFKDPELAVSYAVEWFLGTFALFALIWGLKRVYDLFADNQS